MPQSRLPASQGFWDAKAAVASSPMSAISAGWERQGLLFNSDAPLATRRPKPPPARQPRRCYEGYEDDAALEEAVTTGRVVAAYNAHPTDTLLSTSRGHAQRIKDGRPLASPVLWSI